MQLKTLPIVFILVFFILPSCNTSNLLSGNNAAETGGMLKNIIYKPQPLTTNFKDADSRLVLEDSFGNNLKASSLTDLPISAEGGYMLSPGFFEGDFESYCLHPGTHGPSKGDGYLLAPLKGSRKDVVESILYNTSFDASHNQKQTQLLIWSVLAKADFRKLPLELKAKATQLLSPKQVFELNGGALGLIPDEITANINSRMPLALKKIIETENNLRNLFAKGINRYEDFETYAVLNQAARIDRPDIKRGRWSKHPKGYYIRFFPEGYKRTTIQVYVPDNGAFADSVSNLTFDPSTMVAVPANSQAQRIGIGGPLGKILKKGGEILRKKQPQNPPPNPPAPPKGNGPKGGEGQGKTSGERRD